MLTLWPVVSRSVYSGAEIIQDRIVFAATNYKPLKQLRDAWASDASGWLQQYNALKRAYERELQATRVAEARAAQAGTSAGGDTSVGGAAPAKRMRVRSAQKAKDKYPGSLTVNPDDTCVFIKVESNPLWSRVKMDDDGRTGLVSASKVRAYADPTLPPRRTPPSHPIGPHPPTRTPAARGNQG
jgi:hypothetical protein